MRKLLVLDLDETLIYATSASLDRPADFILGPYHVYRRPGVAGFIQGMRKHFELAVWTSSGASYAQGVVRELFGSENAPVFVWSSERCTRHFDAERYCYILSKDLNKLKRRGYRLEQVLIVDDSPEKLRRHYGNLVRIAPYTGAQVDHELSLLGQYLIQISAHDNVRTLEKRGWRQGLAQAVLGRDSV